MFRTKVVQKINKHIFRSINFFFWKSCRLWDNVEKFCTAGQATDDNTAHAHCMLGIPKVTNTLRIRNAYCFSIATMVARTPSVLRHTYIVCLNSYLRVLRTSGVVNCDQHQQSTSAGFWKSEWEHTQMNYCCMGSNIKSIMTDCT
jgi:hypothetical protein